MITNNPRKRLEGLIGQLLSTKEDITNKLYGLLGTYDSEGNQVVEVENREGFVYVRIGGEISEVIEASNQEISPEWDVKVELVKSKKGNFYEVLGKDISQYSAWGENPFLDLHGLQHMFGVGDSEGVDPVFIYKRQLLQPLGVHPNPTGSMTAIVEADFYIWAGIQKYFPGAQTSDFTNLVPSDNTARYILVYLDGDTESLGYVTGTSFITSQYITGTVDYIPEVSLTEGIPLAAIYLASGTTSIDWDNIFDVRNFLNEGGYVTGSINIKRENTFVGNKSTINFHEGPGIGIQVVNDTDEIDITISFTGSVGAGGSFNGIPIFDSGAFVATGTILSFDDNLTAVATGTSIFISSTGGGGNIDGSGVAMRLAYWITADTISSDSDALFNGTVMGIGANLDPAIRLNVAATYTGSSGTFATINSQAISNPTGSMNAVLYGLISTSESQTNTDKSIDTLVGVYGASIHKGTNLATILIGGQFQSIIFTTGSVDTTYAVDASVIKFGRGDVSNAIGVRSKLTSTVTGTVSTFVNFDAVLPSMLAGSVVTNNYGLRVNNLGVSTSTRVGGVLIADQLSATNRTNLHIGSITTQTGTWSIYNESTGSNYFGGLTEFNDAVVLREISVPITPPPNKLILYNKDPGILSWKGSNGIEHIGSSNIIIVKNTSGSTANEMDVGYIDDNGEWKTTTTATLGRVAKWVVLVGGANNSDIYVTKTGRVSVNYVSTAPSAGEFLVTSTTAGKAQRQSTMRPEIFAVCLSAGSNGTVSVLLLNNRVPYDFTSSDNLFAIAGASDSNFTSTISGAPSGTSVVYGVVSAGSENAIVPVASTELSKIILHNTTRGTSAKIASVNIGTNTITVTSAADITGWQSGDTITVQSQVNTDTVGGSVWLDYEITSTELPELTVEVEIFVAYTDTSTISTLRYHPYESGAVAKRRPVVTQVVSGQFNGFGIRMPLIQKRYQLEWDAGGAGSTTITSRLFGVTVAEP